MPTNAIQAYVPDLQFLPLLPFLILTLGGMVVLGYDALAELLAPRLTKARLTPRERDRHLGWITIATILLTGFIVYFNVLDLRGASFLEGALRGDSFGTLAALTILFAALAFTMLAPNLIEKARISAGEFYSLLLFATTGMTMLAICNELITAYICIEIQSLALYVLTGINRRSLRGGEAAFKYFILGAFSSAFLVLGIAFLFGSTGTTQLFGSLEPQQIAQGLPNDVHSFNLGINEVILAGERPITLNPVQVETPEGEVSNTLAATIVMEPLKTDWVILGFVLLLVGICFKLSIAPFHMWAPDVYAGAPTVTALFIATASKVSGFAFLVHVLESLGLLVGFEDVALPLLATVAVISMVWGNLGALVQTNMKRMLAYSSIAHGGYILIGLCVLLSPESTTSALGATEARTAIIMYLFSYTIMNIIAFGVAAYLGPAGGGEISNYRGLAKRNPLLAAGMAIAMVSLTGIPPTVGFVGKFYIFKEAVEVGLTWLTVIAVLMSALSAYYYLRVVVAMYMQPEEAPVAVSGATGGAGVLARVSAHAIPLGIVAVLGTAIALVFLIGLFPRIFLGIPAVFP